MSDVKSCLVNKLGKYINLDDDLERLIANLEKNEENFAERVIVYKEGEQSQNLYVVKNGWFFSYRIDKNGNRLVVKLHLPGDIIGFNGVAFDHYAMALQSCTSGTLCPFEKSDLDIIFTEAPQLTALLFTIAVREQIVFIDRLQVVSRMSAEARLAFMLLEIVSRLRVTNYHQRSTFRLPLNQTEIGDAIGLTNVSVSRSLGKLEDDGLIRRVAGNVELLNESALVEICSFQDRFSSMDTDWFPQGSK